MHQFPLVGASTLVRSCSSDPMSRGAGVVLAVASLFSLLFVVPAALAVSTSVAAAAPVPGSRTARALAEPHPCGPRAVRHHERQHLHGGECRSRRHRELDGGGDRTWCAQRGRGEVPPDRNDVGGRQRPIGMLGPVDAGADQSDHADGLASRRRAPPTLRCWRQPHRPRHPHRPLQLARPGPDGQHVAARAVRGRHRAR